MKKEEKTTIEKEIKELKIVQNGIKDATFEQFKIDLKGFKLSEYSIFKMVEIALQENDVYRSNDNKIMRLGIKLYINL